MHLKHLACALALLATGCGTTPTPIAPAAPQPPMRKLLSEDSVPARMWALRYNSTSMKMDSTVHSMSDCYAQKTNPFEIHTYGPSQAWCYMYTDVDIRYDRTGPGKFEAVGHGGEGLWNSSIGSERFIYTVPEGQVLIVNHVGGPDLNINGFPVPSNRDVEYRFGGGEVVLFGMANGSWAEGFVADEAMFTGSRGTKGTAK